MNRYSLPRNISASWIWLGVFTTAISSWGIVHQINLANALLFLTGLLFAPLWMLVLSRRAVELTLDPAQRHLTARNRWTLRVVPLDDIDEVELRRGQPQTLSHDLIHEFRDQSLIFIRVRGERAIRFDRPEDDDFEAFLSELRRLRPNLRVVDSGLNGWRRRVRS